MRSKFQDIHYIPKLEELHIGYQCEYFESFSTKIDQFEPTEITGDLLEEVDQSYLNINYRTKYLDKDDLISLGFEMLDKAHPSYGKETYFIKSYDERNERDPRGFPIIADGSKYTWIVELQQHYLHINKRSQGGFTGNSDTTELLYYGLYKSINEFKKLCSWLQIPE